MTEELLPKHGGYRKLKSFQVARLVYDVTVRFCEHYVDRRSRTGDQMVQAARSGVQNTAEGSQASGTSRKMESELTNVARASLEELKLDYEDFLRQNGLAQWERNDPRRQALIDRRPADTQDVARWTEDVHEGRVHCGQSGLCGRGGQGLAGSSTTFSESTRSTSAEIMANGELALIDVACALLSRQLTAQSNAFEQEGGFTERLYQRRTAHKRLRDDPRHNRTHSRTPPLREEIHPQGSQHDVSTRRLPNRRPHHRRRCRSAPAERLRLRRGRGVRPAFAGLARRSAVGG
ncbi:MAG: four helix bundle protein [Armatimonadetes bacterium CG17_big_fil_post_rev_8_21_14_2_50_66_6]|nr:four helix bundle protein [Armatimonadota bacterium]NCQ28943.1 four helix bundle protein [Armatimonadota bacterium]NDK14705.1 four helix bundle protein [Armatimonadota bacterium]PIW13100.1 MAG: four helix bundle protein [Armatimonadetes bacterium CG17_big_fil_post_rev_8_21_14_2_50_66_6]PJB63153.1 MAG: four helix bundle protein [Armatimonadetes bacterium CG_4_9_14_3_um_filter_66_14]